MFTRIWHVRVLINPGDRLSTKVIRTLGDMLILKFHECDLELFAIVI